MTEPTVGRLRVDGASLQYEVRGHGPLLLLIPGGTGGAASCGRHAPTARRPEAGRVRYGTGATSWRTPYRRCR